MSDWLAAAATARPAATLLALKWLVPVGVFVWWRRRAERLLKAWRVAVREDDRKRRGNATQPSLLLRTITFVTRVRNPAEWLLLWWSVHWLLPEAMKALLEVQLLNTIMSWTLGGALVVSVIDGQEVIDGARDDLEAVTYKIHVADDPGLQQADGIGGDGVAEAGVELLRHRGAAGDGQLFHHPDLQSAPGEVPGADQAVMAGAYDEGIVTQAARGMAGPPRVRNCR